jgi:hypothetical protein
MMVGVIVVEFTGFLLCIYTHSKYFKNPMLVGIGWRGVTHVRTAVIRVPISYKPGRTPFAAMNWGEGGLDFAHVHAPNVRRSAVRRVFPILRRFFSDARATAAPN